jgi:hypothetical protein
VGAARDDQRLHIIGGELHGAPDLLAQTVGAAHGQDRLRQPPLFAFLVLRDDCVERPVDGEAGVQGFGAGGKGVEVVADGVAGQWPGGLGANCQPK